MTTKLTIDEKHHTFMIGWFDTDDDEVGLYLGRDAVDQKDTESWETFAAMRAVQTLPKGWKPS